MATLIAGLVRVVAMDPMRTQILVLVTALLAMCAKELEESLGVIRPMRSRFLNALHSQKQQSSTRWTQSQNFLNGELKLAKEGNSLSIMTGSS